ncbi:MAG: hypothetical protein R3F65_06670 [bacterium]
MRTCSALLLIATLTGTAACGAVDDSSGGGTTQGRIVPFLSVKSQSTLDVIDGDRLAIGGPYTIEVSPLPHRAYLTWQGWTVGDGDDTWLDLVATQRLDRAPLGQRYLGTEDFEAIELSLTHDGERIEGVIQRIDLRLDVLLHIHHATLEARFVPTHPDRAPIELRLEITGYIDSVGCTTRPDTYGTTTLDIRFPNDAPDDPPECVEIFDRLRATPTDPDFPPGPYDLYADDQIDGLGGSTPVFPVE